MSDVAIRAENLGKMYRIGGQQERYKRFTETVMDTLTAPIHRLRNLGKPTPPEEILWALKDVSFEIKRGEAVGIIGRNGAGKSTLLKVLSRITEPTTGRVELHGRVGSLLEVGTGFHPELTGRENIYLNGAILGMKRQEIEKKFDEIVEFAEIEQFLDTPVKRYSSGMYVRLAFAVAAHLEPEILLVDEVLAVGDAEFQKKCLGKMGEVAGEGRTVLFVSHNMAAVEKLCPRSLLLSCGCVHADGDSDDVMSSYLHSAGNGALTFGVPVDLRSAPRWGGTGEARLSSVEVFDPQKVAAEASFRGGAVGFRIALEGNVQAVKAVGIQICDTFDRKLINVNTLETGKMLSVTNGDSVEISIDDVRLRPGEYKVGFWLGARETAHIDVVADYCVLRVLPPHTSAWLSNYDGVFRCPFTYRILK